MIEVISRKEAKARILKFYFTGKLCKRGHIAPRWVSSLACTECSAARQAEFRQKNNAHYLERDRIYREKTKDVRNAQERARYAKDPEKHRAKTKRQYVQNGETIRAKRIAYHYEVYKDPNVRRAAAERTRQWALDHPEESRINVRNAKAKRKNAVGVHSAEDIKSILKLQKRKCAYCKLKLGKKYHVDHIVPLARGGTNDRKNLQITCADCNLSKGARDPIFHAQQLGMLL